MNLTLEKLSKYLPYGVQIQRYNSHPIKLMGMDCELGLLYGIGSQDTTDIDEQPSKPILYDFPDLIKEIAIENEYASYYCGRNIGDKVIPAIEVANMSWKYGFYEIVDNDESITSGIKLKSNIDGSLIFITSMGMYVRAYEGKPNSIAFLNTFTVPKIQDMLRSLHFNLDFEENEFIKKEI